ncbi:hypothetical protein [Methylocystis sp.]|uniref:hypothetical protein n=1 Tax=Methylocystis sp. TaxID=1911079 RepID=UPI0027373445|nr:hypothetical protein [Methylocystis sp.]MDP3552630.1 hypothetical protein [Methylocystis sp.]
MQFDSQEALEAWLTDQPREASVAIAARAAVRALPLAVLIARPIKPRLFENLNCALFRATALAWVAATYRTPINVVLRSASDAAEAAAYAVRADSSAASDAAEAAAYAVRADSAAAADAAAAADVAVRATYAVAADGTRPLARAAARAAAYAARAADAYGADIAWEAVSADARFIVEDGAVPKHVSKRARKLASDEGLWLNDTPGWATDHWHSLREALPREDDWQVWIDWYQRRLDGRSASQDIELVYARVPIEEWEKGPAAANRWIKERLDELRSAEVSEGVQIGDSVEAEVRHLADRLQQDPHGATIHIVGGKARIASVLHEDDAAAARDPQTVQLHDRARVRAAAARDRVQRLANQRGFEGIALTVDELTGLLAGDTLSLAANISTAWELSTAIGTFIERDDAVKAERGGLTSQMDADARETLDQLVTVVAPLVRRFPTARENDEEARRFRQPRDAIEPPKRIVEKAAAEKLIEPRSETILAIAVASAERGDGVQADKSRSWLSSTARNVLLAFILAAAGVGALAKTFGDEVVKDFYEHSQSREKIRRFMLEIEDDAFRLFQGLPPDVGAAVREVYRRLREGNPPPPVDPTYRD